MCSIMDRDNTTKFQDLSENDIEEMSEETGIEEEIIAESVNRQAVDEIYLEQQAKNNEKDNGRLWSVVQMVSNVRKIPRLILKILFRKTQLPKKAEVTSLDLGESTVTITLKSSLSDGDELKQQCTFDLDSETDLQDLTYMMKKANVSQPSQLQNKTVPVSVQNYGELEITNYTKPRSISGYLDYYIDRAVLYLHLMEYDNRSRPKPTRNFSLALIVISGMCIHILDIYNLLPPVALMFLLSIYIPAGFHYVFKSIFDLL